MRKKISETKIKICVFQPFSHTLSLIFNERMKSTIFSTNQLSTTIVHSTLYTVHCYTVHSTYQFGSG